MGCRKSLSELRRERASSRWFTPFRARHEPRVTLHQEWWTSRGLVSRGASLWLPASERRTLVRLHVASEDQRDEAARRAPTEAAASGSHSDAPPRRSTGGFIAGLLIGSMMGE